MKKVIITICLSLIGITSVFAQRQMEVINHGLIAIKTSSGVYISWRILADEYDDASYNLYRDGAKITNTPISTKSNLTDANGTLESIYEVKTVINGTETSMGDSAKVWENSYLDIPVREIDGGYSTYELNDASIGDLDGDGDYEIVVKRLVVNNVVSNTDYHYLEAYEMDGTFMWAINMGPNIFNNVEFNFLVWDLDGDGKAEVTLRTSEGFIDAAGNQIGDIDGDGKTNYRYSISSVGYRQEGPDFLSVIDGQTGVEITRATYIPRVKVTDWGKDDGGHRSTKCMYTAAYLDGKHPSIVIGRGIYQRIALAAWDFDGTSLTQRWYFDTNTEGNEDYYGSGYHNLTLGDVDNDGCDEIMYGSMCIDDDGTGLYSTKLEHGDAQHLTDINPNRKGLEYFGCLENSPMFGGNYRDAGTGEIIIHKSIGRDMGRCGCADITDKYPGMEMWGPSGFPFLSATGETITDLTAPSSMNFFIWWDGDASREILDHAWSTDHGIGTITKYNNGQNTRLLTATGTLSDNWTKGTPSLSADMLGDWREEAMWRTDDNSALRIYATTNPTDLKIYTLMQDPQYRAAIGWQQNSYNQPPHPGFFIGNDMDSIPPSPIMFKGQKVWESGEWNTSASSWLESGTTQTFVNGDKVLFDISGTTSTPVFINENVSPLDIRVIAPQDYTFEGSGNIQGQTTLTKSGKGALYINNDNSYSGLTRVWSGELYLNGLLSQSKVLVKRFASLGGGGTINAGTIIEKYAKLSVGSPLQMIDTLTIGDALVMNDASEMDIDLSINPETNNDLIVINGDWNISGTVSININPYDTELSPGSYLLLTVSGTLTGSLDNIELKGASQWPSELQWSNGELRLVVSDTRLADSIIWNGTINNQWDMFNTLNWLNDGVEDYFLGNDMVTFNDDATNKMVNITGEFTINKMTIDATSTYYFIGNGSITGEGQIIKNGSGNATLSTTNSHTGGNIINGGKLIINDITNESYACPLGISDNTTNVTINSGTLYIAQNETVTTDRKVVIGANNGSIEISSGGNITFENDITGSGYLIKEGSGTLGIKTKAPQKGIIINKGAVQLGSDEANITGPGTLVELNGGTLYMFDNSYTWNSNCSWNISVPEGKTGTLYADSRSHLTGKLTGEGTFNFNTPWIRTELSGNWSTFSGKLNVMTSSNGTFLLNNTYGLGNADLNLGDDVLMIHEKSGNYTTAIGALSGTTSSILGAGGTGSNTYTWKIGSKNLNTTFNGTIINTQYQNSGSKAAITKTGSGSLTLTNANTYTGNTLVEQGTLIVENTTGSATGTASVSCKSGSYFGGNGSISGGLVMYGGAQLLPGYSELGTLTVGSSINLQTGAILMIDVNAEDASSDLLKSSLTIMLNDIILMVTNKSTSTYKAGTSFQILSATNITGDVATIYPSTPGDGLEWDTSLLASDGILRVVNATAIKDVNMTNFSLFPNPAIDQCIISSDIVNSDMSLSVSTLSGRKLNVKSKRINSHNWQLYTDQLSKGVYIVQLTSDNNTVYTTQLVKK